MCDEGPERNGDFTVRTKNVWEFLNDETPPGNPLELCWAQKTRSKDVNRKSY